MLELLFHAKITDRLVAILRQIQHDDPDVLPSLSWHKFESGPRAGTWNWLLESFSRKFMRAEDVFTVADISVHIRPDEQRRLTGRIVDWIESEGLAAHDETN